MSDPLPPNPATAPDVVGNESSRHPETSPPANNADVHEKIETSRGQSSSDAVLDIGETTPASGDEHAKSRPEPKPGLKNFWRIMSYSTALDRTFIAAAVISSGGAGAALPLMNVVFGHLVRDFNGYFIPGSNVTQAQFLATVNQNALYILYLFIGKFVLGYISIYSFRMTGIRISAAVRLAYLASLFAQPISAVDKLPPGAATDSLTTAANTIQVGISDKLAILVQSFTLIITAYIVAFRYSWALTLASSSCILFIFIVYGAIMPFWIKFEASVNDTNAKASGVAGETFKSIRTVKSLCAENAMRENYASWVDKSRATGLKMSPIVAVQFAPAFFSIYADMALTFWFGVKLYSRNDIPNIGNVVT